MTLVSAAANFFATIRTVIALRGILKRHLRPFRPPVLDGVDLTLAAGETCGLCGPGASGKSLLLKIACGLVAPDGGSVAIDGIELGSAPAAALADAQARIGMLFQNNALFDSFSVFDNVAFPLRQRALKKGEKPDETEVRSRTEEALRGVGLLDHAAKLPSQLSGGQRKRVALARAVVARPPIVIYDEPTAGLDPVTTAKIYDLLAREREVTGATTLVVSSDIPALREFVPRLCMLYGGRIVYDGPAADAETAGGAVVRQFVRGDLEGPL